MKSKKQISIVTGFTLIELLMIIAVLVFLAAFLLPSLRPHHYDASRINCVNNLKQVGLGFRVWSGDNNDKYPMLVSTNQGGSMELALAGDASATFQVMSNELSTPKILVCRNDSSRSYATNFTSDFKSINLSYFVGVDAVETNVTMLLSGDRNITNGTRLRSGMLELTTNQLSGWTSEIHQKAGNICLADGSVQQVSIFGLRAAASNTGVATNRLALP
jgi:competence protein ComGC